MRSNSNREAHGGVEVRILTEKATPCFLRECDAAARIGLRHF